MQYLHRKGDRPAPPAFCRVRHPPTVRPVRRALPGTRRGPVGAGAGAGRALGGRGAVPAAGAEGVAPLRHLPLGASLSARSCSRQRPAMAALLCLGKCRGRWGGRQAPASPGSSLLPAPLVSTGSVYSSLPLLLLQGRLKVGQSRWLSGFAPACDVQALQLGGDVFRPATGRVGAAADKAGCQGRLR